MSLLDAGAVQIKHHDTQKSANILATIMTSACSTAQ